MPDLSGVVLEIDGPNVPGSQGGEAYGTNFFAQKVFRAQDNSAHLGCAHSTVHIEGRPIGSGQIGPNNADHALSLSLLKQNFAGACADGELDGMNIVVRNGGANSDTTGILFNIANYGVGFTAVFESVTSLISGGSVTKQIDCQLGLIDSRTNHQYGLVLDAFIGQIDVGLKIQSSAGAWTDFISLVMPGGVETFRLSGVGEFHMRDAAGAGGEIIQGVGNGTFYLKNNGSASQIFTIDQSGNLATAGTIGVGSIVIVGGTSATANAGSASLPANPVGFTTIKQGATTFKVPYYNI
jgi:hypothetical protein